MTGAPVPAPMRLTSAELDSAHRVALARYTAEQDADAYLGAFDGPMLTKDQHVARAAGEAALAKLLGLTAVQSWNGDELPFDLEVRTIMPKAPAVLRVSVLDPDGAYILLRQVTPRRFEPLGWVKYREATKVAYHQVVADLDMWKVPAAALRPIGRLMPSWIEPKLDRELSRRTGRSRRRAGGQ